MKEAVEKVNRAVDILNNHGGQADVEKALVLLREAQPVLEDAAGASDAAGDPEPEDDSVDPQEDAQP